MAVEITLIRKVTNENGLSITVGPWEEDSRAVALTYDGLEVAMMPECARAVGEALIACAEELGA
jgi:hypothetical protein